jgi:hypothetical protein
MILSSQDKGDINETECIFIMREIYKREREIHGSNEALGYLMNMMVKAIDVSE